MPTKKKKKISSKPAAKKTTNKKATKKSPAKKLSSKLKTKAPLKAKATKKRAPDKKLAKALKPASSSNTSKSLILGIGEKAPEVALFDQSGKLVRLSDYIGQKNVVLYFYPKDDTPGCTIEACAFRDRTPDVTATDTVIFGISPDDEASHQRFISKYNLSFSLLIDEGHKIAEKFGVWVEKNMYGKKSWGVQRATFIIDKAGAIIKIWPRVKVEGHSEEVLETLRALS